MAMYYLSTLAPSLPFSSPGGHRQDDLGGSKMWPHQYERCAIFNVCSNCTRFNWSYFENWWVEFITASGLRYISILRVNWMLKSSWFMLIQWFSQKTYRPMRIVQRHRGDALRACCHHDWETLRPCLAVPLATDRWRRLALWWLNDREPQGTMVN